MLYYYYLIFGIQHYFCAYQTTCRCASMNSILSEQLKDGAICTLNRRHGPFLHLHDINFTQSHQIKFIKITQKGQIFKPDMKVYAWATARERELTTHASTKSLILQAPPTNSLSWSWDNETWGPSLRHDERVTELGAPSL